MEKKDGGWRRGLFGRKMIRGVGTEENMKTLNESGSHGKHSLR